MNLDKYKQELLKAIENPDNIAQIDNFEQTLLEAKIASKNYLTKTKNINICITEYNMLILKRKSDQTNIPYQTIISALIHQYVEDKISLKI